MLQEKDIRNKLAKDLNLKPQDVLKTVELLDEGNTVPFIARYRKEVTGGMTDEKLRDLHEKLGFLRNLKKRKEDILRLLTEKEILTPDLEKLIVEAETQTRLEDIYRPYRPKKRTQATVAREKGLEPLADKILKSGISSPSYALEYVNESVPTTDEALSGAMDIIAEIISDDHQVRQMLRDFMYREGRVVSRKKDNDPGNYEMYADFQEPCFKIQPHRILALNRGEKEGFLKVRVEASEEKAHTIVSRNYKGEGFSYQCVQNAIKDSWKRLLQPSLEREIRNFLTEKAEEQSLKVFKENLRNLLLTPPVKGKRLLGIDPGLRTGCKVACITETGKLLETAVIFPTPPKNEKEKAGKILNNLIAKHNLNAIAIGNGTGCRETEEFVSEMLTTYKLDISYTIVNEAGASIYSASELGSEEFPGLDVAERSAVSIARRLQDPLSELVKIDPGSIGVGQYQHDINQKKLRETLNGVVEATVNLVGVDLNTASSSLLNYVAGITRTVAANISDYREREGLFKSRQELKNVPRLGPAVFKQCAGFLRIAAAENFFDRSAVHPESYEVAGKLMAELGISFDDLGKPSQIDDNVDLESLADRLEVGIPTLEDIISEFKRPGRDPREDLPRPVFKKGVLNIEDLREDMILTGVVRNVVDFGAFIDIGVHQDGLAHISELTDSYVRHPSQVLKVGDIVDVRVLSLDVERKRISLTLKGS